MAKGITFYVKGDEAVFTANVLKQAGTLLCKLAKTKEAWVKEILDEEGEEVSLGAHLLVGGHCLEEMGDKILSKVNNKE